MLAAIDEGGLLEQANNNPSTHPVLAVFSNGLVDQVSPDLHSQVLSKIRLKNTFAVLSDKGEYVLRVDPSTELLFIPGYLKEVVRLNSQTISLNYRNHSKVFVDTVSKAIEIRGKSLKAVTTLLRAILMVNGLNVQLDERLQSLTVIQATEITN